jgi:DNA-binding NarL/FixJ family response regulator
MTIKTRIVLVDDHPIVLGGLRDLVGTQPDLDLVGEATTGGGALRLIREVRPDIAVIDISIPEINGIALSRRLTEEGVGTRLIILTVYEERAYLKQALEAGVSGFVLKRSAAESLLHAMRAVRTGGLYVDPAIAHRVFDTRSRASKAQLPEHSADLTEREREVLKLVALGFTQKEIAARIQIGNKSVETYKTRGIEKLGLRTRAEVVRFAATQGWLSEF